jgi:nicotinamide-nucleotide amidase
MTVRSVPDSTDEDTRRQRAEQVGELAADRGCTIAVAESLTGGMIASALAQAEGASQWFCGSLVAYSTTVKHELLDVPPGPVVSPDAAGVMARRARELLRADLSVAVTGAGGPDTQDGQPPGTVFLAVDDGVDRHEVVRLQVPGDPPSVCAGTVLAALNALVDALTAQPTRSSRTSAASRGDR